MKKKTKIERYNVTNVDFDGFCFWIRVGLRAFLRLMKLAPPLPGEYVAKKGLSFQGSFSRLLSQAFIFCSSRGELQNEPGQTGESSLSREKKEENPS